MIYSQRVGGRFFRDVVSVLVSVGSMLFAGLGLRLAKFYIDRMPRECPTGPGDQGVIPM